MSNFDKFLISIQLFEEYHLERRKALHANKLVRLDAVKSFIRSYYGDLYKEYKELNFDKDVRARDALHKAEELHNEVDELITAKNAIRFLDKVARFKDYLHILQKVYVENLDKQIQNMEKYYQWITDLKKDDIMLLHNDETDDAYDKAVILYEETMRHLGKEPEEEEIIFTFGKCRALSGAEDIDFKGVIYAAKPEGIDCEFIFCVSNKEELITTKEAAIAAKKTRKKNNKKKLKSKYNDAVRVAEDTTAEDITKDTRAENEPKETGVTNDGPAEVSDEITSEEESTSITDEVTSPIAEEVLTESTPALIKIESIYKSNDRVEKLEEDVKTDQVPTVEVSHEVISTEAEPEVKADEQEDAEEIEEVVKESTPKPLEVDSSIDGVEREDIVAEQAPRAAVEQENIAATTTSTQRIPDYNINSTLVAAKEVKAEIETDYETTVVTAEGCESVAVQTIEGSGLSDDRTSDEIEANAENLDEKIAVIRSGERPERKPDRVRCRVWPPAECLKYFKHIFKNISV